MALITAAEARLYIRGLSGTSEDTTLDTLIARVGARLAAWAGFPAESGVASLEQTTYTRFFDGPVPGQPRMLRLDVWPVVSVSTIHDDSDHNYDAATLVDSGDYTLYGDYGLVELTSTGSHGTWGSGRRDIRVVFDAGFATVPADIKEACGLQVAHEYRARDSVGKRQISQAGFSVSPLSLQLLPEVRQALAPYRLVTAWVA